MKKIFTVSLLAFANLISAQSIPETTRKKQEALIEAFRPKFEKYNYLYQMAEWQRELDEALKADPSIAYFWQQKAMPYFKARKYEVGMPFLDKAVALDEKEYLPYRAFMKCIFSKTYKESIVDFENCIAKFGNLYVMDHSYNFYIALCCLQLNDYAKAEKLLGDYVEEWKTNRHDEHPTALFYYGIAQYENQKYEEATATFDRAIKIYPQFSDAKYYKAICLARLNKPEEEVSKLLAESKDDFKSGYKLNEDNTVYEQYPYQKIWR